MERKATIIDIARECGLSKTSVAYALSGKAGGKVSAKSVELINLTAKRLGYCPSIAARTLRSRRSQTIGILLPTPEISFYAELSSILQAKLHQRGYVSFFVFWSMIPDAGQVNRAGGLLASHGVDGIIACELKGMEFNSGIPTVVYGREEPGIDSVLFNERKGFGKAVATLFGQGRSRIAYIGHGDTQRSKGYLDGLRMAGLKAEPELIHYGGDSHESGLEGMRRFIALKRRPDAILCANDDVALAAMSEARRNGLRIPGEIAFVGADDSKGAKFAFPSLSSHRMSAAKAADELIESLFMRIDSPEAPPRSICLDLEFIPRESTGEDLR